MKLVDLIRNDLKEIISIHSSTVYSESQAMNLTRNGKVLSLNTDALQILFNTVNEIMSNRPKIKGKYSNEFVRQQLIDIIFSWLHAESTLSIDSKLLKDSKKLLNVLKNTSEQWDYLIPIINLKFNNIKKLSIGNVGFYDLKIKTLKYLEKKFKIKLGFKKTPHERKSEFVKNNIHVLAVVRVIAGETIKAKNLALFKVESCLNILRLYNSNNQIGIQKDFGKDFYKQEIYFSHSKTRATGGSLGGLPPVKFFPYSLTLSNLNLIKKEGKLNLFNKLLREENPNKLAKKILMSIHWYGLAVKDNNKVDRYVKLVIALESLLLLNKDRLKKQTLSDRVAFILGKDKDTRSKWYDLIEKTYSIRSAVVHEGKEDVTEENVLTLMSIVTNLIFIMIRLSSRFQSLSEIDKKIRDIKFGSQLRGI